MHGVAFDADVLFVAIQLAEPDPDYDPVDLVMMMDLAMFRDAPDFTGIDNFLSSCLKYITT